MNDMPVFAPDEVTTKTALEDIAIETGTPIEVLFAAGEQAGAQSPDEFLNIARERGQQIGPRFKAGEDPNAIVGELFGEEAQRSFRDYATEVRAQLYGTPTVQEANQAKIESEGFGGLLKRRGRQFVRGATEVAASIPEAKAIAQAQMDDVDTPAFEMEGYDRGEDIRDWSEDTFGAPNPEDRSFWGMVAEGAGNLVGMGGAALAAGAAGTAVAGPLGGAVAGLATGAGIGSSLNTSQLYREAKEMGADEATAERAARWGAVIGASEILPIARAFKVLPQSVRGRIGNGVMKRFADIAQSSGEEAAQEYLATVANNIVAQQLFDPDRGWTEDATEGALVGAVLGAGAGAIGTGVDAYRNRPRPGQLPGQMPEGEAQPPAAAGMPVAGPGREPEQQLPAPMSDALKPQVAGTETPEIAPAPMTDVLSAAPAPTLGGFQQGQDVRLQFVDPETGEMSDGVMATFVGEDAAKGYASFRDETGAAADIDLSEIQSGSVIVSPSVPEEAPQAEQPEQPVSQVGTAAPEIETSPVPEQVDMPQPDFGAGIPEGVDIDAFNERVAVRRADGMTEREAYMMTLQDAMDGLREDVGQMADDSAERNRQVREEQSRIDEAMFTDDRGQPVVFPTEAIARNRLGAGYSVEPFGGGFIGVRQQEDAGNADGNDGLGGDGGIVAGGRDNLDGGDADRAPVDAGGMRGAEQPAVPGVGEGVSDAAGDANDGDALTQPDPDLLNKIDETPEGQWWNTLPDAEKKSVLTRAGYENASGAGVNWGILGKDAREKIIAARNGGPAQEDTSTGSATADASAKSETAPAEQETDPVRLAVRDAVASGPVQHTTRKGKVLDGYVLKGMKPAQVKDTIDKYAFPKDGGVFIRKARVEAFIASETTGDQATAAKWAGVASKIIKADNKEGDNDFSASEGNAMVMADGSGDADIDVTTWTPTVVRGQRATEQRSKKLKYSQVRDQLTPQARAEVERIIAQEAQAREGASEGVGPATDEISDPSGVNVDTGASSETTPSTQDPQPYEEMRSAARRALPPGHWLAGLTYYADTGNYSLGVERFSAKGGIEVGQGYGSAPEEAAQAGVRRLVEDFGPATSRFDPVKVEERSQRAEEVAVARRERFDRIGRWEAESGQKWEDLTAKERSKIEKAWQAAGQPDAEAITEAAAETDPEPKPTQGSDAAPKVGDRVLVKFESPAREERMTVIKGPFNTDAQGRSYQVMGDGTGAVNVRADRVRLAPALKDEAATTPKPNEGPRLTTRDEGRAAGEAWAAQGNAETMADDPAMGNASADARGGWTAGYRSAKQEMEQQPATPDQDAGGGPAVRNVNVNVVGADGMTDAERGGPLKKKIEDFGEKIGGARKDKAGRFIDDLGGEIDAASMTLSDAFPKPDYPALAARGVPMKSLAGVAAIRGNIPRKPNKNRSWRVRDWAENVTAARALAAGLMDGSLTVEDIDAGSARTSRSGKRLSATITAFAGLPIDMLDEASGAWEVTPVFSSGATQSLSSAERDVAYYALEKPGSYRTYGRYSTPEKAAEGLQQKIKEAREAKSASGARGSGREPARLGVYSKRGADRDHFIGFKGSGVVRLMGGFESASAARAYLDENKDSLQQRAESLRDGLNERGEENRDRQGPAHRKGNVTPQMFDEAFGFRGVEFGNWNNQRERQDSLNRAYDALMDLAGVLEVPPAGLSLNGQLGLAFGARGKGGKNAGAAHYEPGRVVMNLTKKNGAGSLAHEWFHAIDNYLAKEDAKEGGPSAATTGESATRRNDYMSDRASGLRGTSDLRKAYSELWDALNDKGKEWYARSKQADNARSKPYFSTTIEMAARGFEKFVVDRLARRGMINDYLANIDGYSGAYPSTREFRRDGYLEAFEGAIPQAINALAVSEGTVPKLPDPNDSLVFDGPDIGETWITREGRYQIVGRDGGTYSILTPTGATEIYDGADAVEALISESQDATERAKAEARAAAEAKKQDRRDTEERAKDLSDEYEKESGKSTANLYHTYNFPDGVYSRRGMIVKLVEEGWRVTGEGSSMNLRNGSSAFAASAWTKQGLSFASWYGSRLDLRARMDQPTEATPETTAEPEASNDIASAIANAIDEEFGDGSPAATESGARKGKQPDGASDVRTAGQAAKDAASKAGKGANAAMDGLIQLFGGKDTLNSGFTFSEETYKRAKPLFDEAIQQFAGAGADIVQMARALVRALKERGMTREGVTEMTPYLSRYIEEAQGVTLPVPEAQAETTPQAGPPAPQSSPDAYAPFRDRVVEHMRDGGGYGDIRSLRKQAGEALGRKIEQSDYKAVEEAAEEAIVGLAREIAQSDATDAEKFDRMVDLYERQPLLAQKNSTSIENQAYSTPAPLAFVASRLAGITPETRVTEPSAGTGMLLIEADPANVRANEKNPDRVDALRRGLPGAAITQGDATQTDYAPYDVLITNPPFGRVKIDGQEQSWPMARTTTKEIDFAIAWRALQAMPEDGSAVLIVGGVNPMKYQGDSRSNGYMGNGKRQFYANLYDGFNVVDHFTVDGSLYKRQGAQWPVDVVVIRGRGKSALPLPMAKAPATLNSWSDVKVKLDYAETLGTTERQPGVGNPDPAVDAGSGRDDISGLSEPAGGQISQSNAGDGPSGAQPGGESAVSSADRTGEIAGSRDADLSGDRASGNAVDGTSEVSAGQPVAGGVSGRGATVRPSARNSGRDVTPARENTEVESDLQVRYAPRSNARFQVGTLVPVNMRDAIRRALDAIEAKHGPVDQYVADSLGYSLDELLGTESKNGYFSAEQVDALAMAIDNVGRGKGFIIGDQTGVGKGRFVAAMLRFAEKSGRTPVFVTKAPGLYGDMIRDMRDIGDKSAHKGVLMTNNTLRGEKAVPLSGRTGDTLESATKGELDKAIRQMRDTGKLPKGSRFLFTTYSQMQTVAGKEPERRDALRAIAPNAMFVFDESHEAGGGTPTEDRFKKKDAPPTRAEFVRSLVQASNGTVFSSATYAKNPEVMSLYSNTDISDSVGDPSKLGEAISRGGVPLQQVTAAMLTEAGQYARRERSWDGVDINLNPVRVNSEMAENVTGVISKIFEADMVFLSAARTQAVKNLKEQGYANLPGGSAVDVASADQTGFSSVLHNVVSQMLLSLKVDEVAKRAIADHKAGKKPVIAVVNTNGALLQAVIEDEGLAPGAPINVPFDVILHRYVDRLRRITVKDANDTTHRIDLPDSALGPMAVQQLARLHRMIDQTDMKAMTAAPLDRLKDQLQAGGVRVGEITGRTKVIEKGILRSRDASESAKKKQMLAFNSGDLDALVINQAGSTGYSLHAVAGAEGNDGKPRKMLVLQPDPNIDTFMQMLGRIHRTGQTSLPEYDITVSELAVEKRVAAVLMRKMASLSANTTASKSSAVSLDVTDFLNEVGDRVVKGYLEENFDLAVKLDIDPSAEGVASKLTGRLALMAPADTMRVYDELEALYNDEIARLNAIGENPLEAHVVDWQAKPESQSVLDAAKGAGSVFDQDTVLEALSVKNLGKPFKWDQVQDMVADASGDLEVATNKVDDLAPAGEAAMNERLNELLDAETAALETKDSAPKRYTAAQAAVARQRETIRNFKSEISALKRQLRDFAPGKIYDLALGSNVIPSVVIGLDASKVTGNPTARSKYRVRFAVADGMKEIAVPLSKIGDTDGKVAVQQSSRPVAEAAFKAGASSTRESRQVVTGNLINAFSRFEKGQVVKFTMEGGAERYGVALPRGFNAREHMEKQPVPFATADQAIEFLGAAREGVVNDASGRLHVTRSGRGGYKFTAKKAGKEFYAGETIRSITGEWIARSGPLEVILEPDAAARALNYYVRELGTTLQAETFKDMARQITGATIPEEVRAGDASPEMRGDMPADPAFTEDASRAVTRRLVAEIDRVLPGTKVGVRLVRRLHSLKDGAAIMGRANQDGTVEVSMEAAGDAAGAAGILNHEIIHVLRNPSLWRSDYGLFKRGEWGQLVRAAEANPDLVAAVDANYEGRGLTREQMQEEYVAEMYRGWKAQTGDYGAVERALLRIEEFFRALASAFRGEGFDSAGRVMQRIADGGVGGREAGVPNADVSVAIPAEMRAAGAAPDPIAYPSVVSSISKMWSRKPATSEAALNAKEGSFVSNLITNAMASSDRYNTLGLVPGEVLFRDMGKALPSADKWVKAMRQMSAERQEMHAESDVLAQEWQRAYSKDKASGRKLHDLMHESTIEQVDPSERFKRPRKPLDMSESEYRNLIDDKRAKHAELKQRFHALPENMQDIYRKARDAYTDFDAKLIDAMVDAVAQSMDLQAARMKARYEDELQQIDDEGLSGDALKEARRRARSRYNQSIKMLEYSRNARVRKMRLTYEDSRLQGPYFPLMRFGQFFVAARDSKGKLLHFERAATAGAQQRIAAEMEADGLTVETGVMKPEENLSRYVDPNFVADIQEALGEVAADSRVLDAIYQRYLETLPSFSIRKANIHRQGTPGYDKDAIKAFGNRMFHGAHQLARLRHSMDLTKHVENARREAKNAPDPVRAGAVANEMQKRHEWAMNPQGAPWSAWATSAAFVWYLGLTPGAAIVNLSQTTVVGIPMLAAGIKGGTVAKAAKHLTGALADFTAGLKKGDAEWSRGALTSGRLSQDERSALQAAYNSGALDKSQAHDIAAIGDSGVEYSSVREKAMRPIAFMFHHAERLNREVTFLAAYRMAKEAGMDQDAAQLKAGDLTWDTHFNYENWSRPRFMQGDVARVAFVFRQFQVNMLYRLFRDSHQALKGESPEVRKQARAQLIGITASMMAHAGITGTWGYALIMLLAGMFMEGGSDEAEEELKNAIVGTFGAGAGGFLLKGVPGHLTGTDLTARIGMPELWFRSPYRQVEGRDAYYHVMDQMLGAVPSIGMNMLRGIETASDGEVWRGVELMVPKAVRDQMRFMRYLNEGVTTYRGDPLMDDVSAHDAIVQAIGFSPARISERYEQNRRMMNENNRIQDERRKILSDVTRYLRDGKEVSKRAMRKVEQFNQKYPTYPITNDTIVRSLRARERMSEQMTGGVRLNPKLEGPIRENMANSLYN